MKSSTAARLFDEYLDRFYGGVCMDAGACLVCGWKPRPEFRGMYYEWHLHFKNFHRAD